MPRASAEGASRAGVPPSSSSSPSALTDEEAAFIKRYAGRSPYAGAVERLEREVETLAETVRRLRGVTPSDTGLLPPEAWDLAADVASTRGPDTAALHVGVVTKVLDPSPEAPDEPRYVVDVEHDAKYVTRLSPNLSPTDVDEGARVGLDRRHYRVQIPLPARLDACVSMMEVVERVDSGYDSVGGCEEQLRAIREVVELPLLHPERFARLGVEPPKGALLFGPPGGGKTLCARAVAASTSATFVRVAGGVLAQKYIGQGAHLVREIFALARSKPACVLFFDEIDSFGGTRHGGDEGDDVEVNRTMLELLNQLDGFDRGGNVKVLMATNRPDTLDPALTRPGRIDRKVEFGALDLNGRVEVFRVHARPMAIESDARLELVARLCGPGTTGADVACVCREAGMFAVRARRKTVTERDFLDAVEKVIRRDRKFTGFAKYQAYN